MLDVHPPHATTHTWRDFFLHIATIVVGLLIAIALEQSVEALHRAHERRDLRESLRHESEQVLSDAEHTERAQIAALRRYAVVQQQVSDAVRDRRPLAPFPPESHMNFDTPDDPVFRAALASGQISLLTPAEIGDYSEIDGIVKELLSNYMRSLQAREQLAALSKKSQLGLAAGAVPFSHASPVDLAALYLALITVEQATTDLQHMTRYTRGAEIAILRGERDLHNIQAAEVQIPDLP